MIKMQDGGEDTKSHFSMNNYSVGRRIFPPQAYIRLELQPALCQTSFSLNAQAFVWNILLVYIFGWYTDLLIAIYMVSSLERLLLLIYKPYHWFVQVLHSFFSVISDEKTTLK